MSITISNIPPENSVLLDGNNTTISVTSTNGDGHYFRAKIYINDVLFDEQGWSRKDDYTANKDLIFLYNAYFKPELVAFTTGLVEQTHLIKKVKIIIEEKLIDDDSLVDFLGMPEFYIMYNVKSVIFNDNDKISFLGLEPEVLRISKNGFLVIPFFVNASDESILINVKDELNNVLYTTSVIAFSGKKAYLFTLELNDVTIVYDNLYLNVEITVGAVTKTKVYNIIRLPNFDVVELVFRNNFGYYIPAYFDGELENTSGYKVETYETINNDFKIYTIDETGTYKINTGNLNILEKDIINQISLSLDCYFKNGANYLPVNTSTKKSINDKSRLNIYEEDLQFTFKKGLPFENLFTPSSIVSEDPEFYATILNNSGHGSALVPNAYKRLRIIVNVPSNEPLNTLFYFRVYLTNVYPTPATLLHQQDFTESGIYEFEFDLITGTSYSFSSNTLNGPSGTTATLQLLNV